MALDRTPWFVSTPGVHHSSEVARTVAYAATNGATGVAGSSDFKVQAQGTPNGTVQVLPGVAVSESNYSGHKGQSYIMRNASSTNVTITPTTSTGGRTDAVIVRVDDIGLVGTMPENVNTYDYTKLEVIQGVSAGLKYKSELNLNYPFVLLAKITIPASTATITNAMITDLREVVNAREKTITLTHAQIIADGFHDLTATNAFPVGEYFPDYGGTAGADIAEWVRIPEWATSMTIRAEWLGVCLEKLSGNGQVWVTYDLVAQNNPANKTQYFQWSSEDTRQRQNWICMDTRNIPLAYRGKDVAFALRARKDSTAGRVWMDARSGTTLTITFKELAD